MSITDPIALQFRVALRSVATSKGTDLARMLIDLFDALNATYFEGRLAAPVVLIAATSSPRALGDYNAHDPNGIESRIRIAPGVAEVGASFAADVLLHEMIHAWCAEVEQDTERGYKGHGPKFAAKCNEIGRTLGLGDVYARPRGKLKGYPDCAFWPMNVRPAGFYGDNDPRKQPEPKPAPEPMPVAEPVASPAEPNNEALDEIAVLRANLEEANATIATLRAELNDMIDERNRERTLAAVLRAELADAIDDRNGERTAAAVAQSQIAGLRRELDMARACAKPAKRPTKKTTKKTTKNR